VIATDLSRLDDGRSPLFHYPIAVDIGCELPESCVASALEHLWADSEERRETERIPQAKLCRHLHYTDSIRNAVYRVPIPLHSSRFDVVLSRVNCMQIRINLSSTARVPYSVHVRLLHDDSQEEPKTPFPGSIHSRICSGRR